MTFTKPQQKPQVAIRFDPDGTVTEHMPANGKYFKFVEIQKLVGDFVETCIPAVRYTTVYVAENGKIRHLPENQATWKALRWKTYQLNGYARTWCVAGPIVVVGRGLTKVMFK